MISKEEYENLPAWFKPYPIRLNPSQIKYKALKCPCCGAIFSEEERLVHFDKDADGTIFCPIARKALGGIGK